MKVFVGVCVLFENFSSPLRSHSCQTYRYVAYVQNVFHSPRLMFIDRYVPNRLWSMCCDAFFMMRSNWFVRWIWNAHLFHLHTNNVTGQEQIKKRSEVFTSWFKNFLHNTPLEHRDDDSILNLSRIIFSVLTRSDLFRAVSTPLGFDRRTATFHRVLSDSPGVLLKSCIYPDGHEGIDKDMHKEFLRNLFRWLIKINY